ncbi:hypothetical protein DsansV1_C23g0176371 [Dioscorea sansibarensis]
MLDLPVLQAHECDERVEVIGAWTSRQAFNSMELDRESDTMSEIDELLVENLELSPTI